MVRNKKMIFGGILCFLALSLRLFAQTAPGTEIENAAAAEYRDAGGFVYSLQSPTVSTTVSQGYALTITKRVEKTVYLPGDTVEYFVTIMNSGNLSAESVIITDTLSENLTYHTSDPPAAVNSQVLSWNLPELQAGAASEIAMSAVVAPGVPPGESIENAAAFRTPEDVTGHSPAVTILIGNSPDLILEKSVDHENALAGDTLMYTVSVENVGNAAATNTRLYDQLPAQTEFVSCSGTGQYANGILQWNIGELPAGSSASETLKAVVKAAVPSGTVIRNSASVTNAEGVNRSASASTLITETTGNPDLVIEKSAETSAGPGDTLHYRIVFGNPGDAAATGIVISDTLDPQLEFLSASGEYQYESLSGRISWERNTLSSGSRDSLVLLAKVRPGVPDDTGIMNRVKITCNEGESATDETEVRIRSPLLSIEKSAESPQAGAGEELRYTLSVLNGGSGEGRNVTIDDTLPANTEYVSAGGTSEYVPGTHSVRWDIGTLEADMGTPRSVELIVRIVSPLDNGTVISNAASVSCREGFSANTTVDVTVESAPVLELTKSAAVSAFPGDTLPYRIAFNNRGNDIATGTVITDTLPPDVDLISASGTYTYDPAWHALEWEIGDLQPDIDSLFSVQVRIDPSLSGVHELSNRAWIRANEAAAVSDISQTAVRSLNLQITADPDSILGDGSSRSEITATLTDASGQPVPDGTELVFTASHGSFSAGSDTVRTTNGIAVTQLISSPIEQEYLPVKIKAEMSGTPAPVRDSTTVIFYTRSVVGVVTDSDNEAVSGAVVIIMQGGEVIGTDTTSADGTYRILVFTSGEYTIIIRYIDEYGTMHTIQYVINVDISGEEQFEIIQDKCAVSGRIIDSVSGQPIREAGIPVIISTTGSAALPKTAKAAFSDTTYTDTSGYWAFTELEPGTYRLDIIYEGAGYHHGETQMIVLDTPGKYMMNTDISLRPVTLHTYKTVDNDQVFTGDSLTYRLYYETENYDIGDTLRICDPLPPELEWIPASIRHSPELITEEQDPLTGELCFYRDGMPANAKDSIIFRARVKEDPDLGSVSITNRARIFTQSDTAYTADDPRSNATTRILTPFLAVKKAVNRRIVEPGDILTYTVTLENRSSNIALENLLITDILPPGFRYREGRSFLDGVTVPDPSISMPGERQTLIWTIADTLLPGQSRDLKYRVIAGLDSRLGENENLVTASAQMPGDISIASNTASAEVILKPGMIHERGFIFGKVFYDMNGNDQHDSDEETVKGVEIITEEGIRVVTDEYGKYSIPNIRTGDHVLRINRRSLPDNARLKLSSPDFLGDALSRRVKVSYSGIARANFLLESRDKDVSLPERGESIEKDILTVPDSAVLDIEQQVLPGSLRIVTYQPWSINLKLEFFPGSAVPTRRDECALDEIAAFMKWQPHLCVTVRGHTDNVPVRFSPFRDNQELSLSRAEAVRDYLKEQGIPEERMAVNGCGSSEPVMTNVTVAGRAANRRVEMRFCMADTRQRTETELNVRTDLRRSGSLPLHGMRFISLLPEGFRFAEAEAGAKDIAVKSGKGDQDTLVWDPGDHSGHVPQRLCYTLVPADHRKIRTRSTLSGWLEYKTPEGKSGRTQMLRNTVPTPVEEVLFDIDLEGARFATGSWYLKDAVLPELEKLGEFLNWRKKMCIRIEGFTDSIGTYENNKELSRKRAGSVKDYLVKHHGIAPERMHTLGYGEDFPVAGNGTAAGRAKNRRVEIFICSDFVQKENGTAVNLKDSLREKVTGNTVNNKAINPSGRK